MGRVGKMTCLLHKKVKQCKFLVKTFTPWRARDETTKGWERIHFDSILNTTQSKNHAKCVCPTMIVIYVYNMQEKTSKWFT